ncbi:hypothetical protein ACWC2K_04920 [Streptomyces chattanoogensis]
MSSLPFPGIRAVFRRRYATLRAPFRALTWASPDTAEGCATRRPTS